MHPSGWKEKKDTREGQKILSNCQPPNPLNLMRAWTCVHLQWSSRKRAAEDRAGSHGNRYINDIPDPLVCIGTRMTEEQESLSRNEAIARICAPGDPVEHSALPSRIYIELNTWETVYDDVAMDSTVMCLRSQ